MTTTSTGEPSTDQRDPSADSDANRRGPHDNDLDNELFVRFRATGARRIRNQIVERHLGLAAHIAKRYSRGGIDDDVRQVAMLGLVKAVDRFDPEHGAAFGSFAGLTIEGEIKRHFRDKTWTVRVPRRAKDLHLLVRNAGDELSTTTGKSPSIDEIAEHLGIERDDVLRGLAATAAYQVGTLDTSTGDDEQASDRQRALAADESGYGDTVDRHLIDQLLAQLPERERRIVELRFYGDKSQSEIADEVGISQMHVSRLLRKSFEQMRALTHTDSDIT
ncbi:MAG: SigB/SigF/SigG family RNA polymerase sigma factor [Ilumatobacter sp.]|uniref:SigB/SigF/SigG family RNA polymerase sigma factor n=1 Tax=Ilumatobacter sp. TaxID=1967498 RepID=UPI00391B8E64